MAYFQLYIREEDTWTVDFGDKDRDCVEFERDEAHCDTPRRCKKIVRFDRVPTQAQVMAKRAELNA